MKQLWNGGWTFLKTSTGTTLEQVVEHLGEFVQVDLPHDWLIYDSHITGIILSETVKTASRLT